MPLVSVVMSAFNAAPYIGLAIKSILQQTLSDLELIIVDDSSTDGTPDILKAQSDPRIRVIRNEHNLGPTRSRNRALDISSGEFIAIQDADDVSLPTRLEKQVNFLRTNTQVGVVGSAHLIIDIHGRILGSSYPPTDDQTIRQQLLIRNPFTHSAVIMRRACIEKVGQYRVDQDGLPVAELAEDWDLWLRISEHFHMANVGEPLVKLRRYSTSSVRTRRKEHFLSRDLVLYEALERQANLLDQYRIPKESVALGWFILAMYKLALADEDLATFCFDRALTLNPQLVNAPDQLYPRIAYHTIDVCGIAEVEVYSRDWYLVGYGFMNNISALSSSLALNRGCLFGRFHMTIAFEAAIQNQWPVVWRNYLRACKYDLRWAYRIRAIHNLIRILLRYRIRVTQSENYNGK